VFESFDEEICSSRGSRYGGQPEIDPTDLDTRSIAVLCENPRKKAAADAIPPAASVPSLAPRKSGSESLESTGRPILPLDGVRTVLGSHCSSHANPLLRPMTSSLRQYTTHGL
jgi:hypothetical protein